LNFLLTLARQNGLDLIVETSTNHVYKELFQEVWKRRWSEQGRLESHKSIDEETFGRIFAAIALAAWHNGGTRAVTAATVKVAIEKEGLDEERRRLEQEAERGSLRLLTAFYFREGGCGPSAERAWEFTHKSFGEYLISRRIVWQIKKQIN
jgi:hypothetical protein